MREIVPLTLTSRKPELEQHIDPFAEYHDLISQENGLTPHIEIDDTLRIKVLDKCGMSCHFCHNEGTPVASNIGFQALRVSIYAEENGIPFTQSDINMSDEDSFREALVGLRDAGLAKEVHWTGGEPTLSKSLPGLTSVAKLAGYTTKMTSNGQSGARGLAELVDAGLDGVNFSIFGTTPQELADTQGPAFKDNLRLAQLRLTKMGEAMIAACELGLNVKANIVISGEEDIDRGLRLLASAPEEVKVRFQADTSNRTPSLAAIYKLMTELDARPIDRTLVAGCSIDNYDYQLPDQRVVTFKQTRFSRLPGVCDGCPIDAAGDCHEGYYGVRFYKDEDNTYWLSPCIQRMDESQPLPTFLGSRGLGATIKAYRDQDYESLQKAHQTV